MPSNTATELAAAIVEGLARGREGCECVVAVHQGQGLTHCPSHADGSPALTVYTRRGRVALACDFRCRNADIEGERAALGLWYGAPDVARSGLSLDALAAELGMEPAFLLSLEVRNGVWGSERRSCVDIEYFDREGQLVAVRKRLRTAGGGRFDWRRGDRIIPYGLPRLGDAIDAGAVLVFDSEIDCWACWAAGVPALGVPGAGAWRRDWAEYVAGIAEVGVWTRPDEDQVLARNVAYALPDVRIIEAASPSRLWLELQGDADAVRARLQELFASAPRASDLRREAEGREARGALAIAGPLLEAPDLLGRITAAVRDAGYAGDTTPGMLAYLALTSRVLV